MLMLKNNQKTILFLYPFPLEKGYTNFCHKGLKYEKHSRSVYTCIYISDQEAKRKLFSQCPSDRPSVCPYVLPSVRKTWERIKINACGFDLFGRCVLNIEFPKISTRSHEHLWSWSRMKFLPTLLYLGIRLMILIRNFFILKIYTRN